MSFVPGQIVEVVTGPAVEHLAGRRFKITGVEPGGILRTDWHRLGIPAVWCRIATGGTPALEPGTAPTRLTDGQRLALDALYAAGPAGLTDFELAERTGRKQTSIGKRRYELVRLHLVESRLVTRPSDTLSPSQVWAITSLGVDTWRRLNPQERVAS